MGRILNPGAAEGVDPVTLAAFARGVASLPWDVRIGWLGAVRNDAAAQVALFAAGRTKARTLDETPHGKGYALDGYPILANGRQAGDSDFNVWEAYGHAMEAQGLVWGGRFAGFFDGPHVERKGWRSLPSLVKVKPVGAVSLGFLFLVTLALLFLVGAIA